MRPLVNLSSVCLVIPSSPKPLIPSYSPVRFFHFQTPKRFACIRSQMSSSSATQVAAEYAKSGRSSCKKCSEPIEAKALRLGLISRDARGFDVTKWHHLDCFNFGSQNVASVEKIKGFQSLKVLARISILGFALFGYVWRKQRACFDLLWSRVWKCDLDFPFFLCYQTGSRSRFDCSLICLYRVLIRKLWRNWLVNLRNLERRYVLIFCALSCFALCMRKEKRRLNFSGPLLLLNKCKIDSLQDSNGKKSAGKQKVVILCSYLIANDLLKEIPVMISSFSQYRFVK